METVEPELSVFAYPNPSRSFFTLNINSTDDATPVSVQIMDLNGKVVATYTNVSVMAKGGSSLRIAAEELAAGIYIAEIKQGKERKTVKLVKL